VNTKETGKKCDRKIKGPGKKKMRSKNKGTRKEKEQKQQKLWIKIRYFTEMSNYETHKSPEYATTQQTNFTAPCNTIQQAGMS
jgi:hypothetical protein